ncbi:unnamed protein product [Wuchereria bancrofti]|uniref:Uncharacterized protein n=1 Tax=Wuchereria bancrofti TaxID=6293 RepID=A0A3P7DWH6_WUCBA|nr:unnamed protein product [Wuchereria bancrofti]
MLAFFRITLIDVFGSYNLFDLSPSRQVTTGNHPNVVSAISELVGSVGETFRIDNETFENIIGIR